jgi:hypothetical protein
MRAIIIFITICMTATFVFSQSSNKKTNENSQTDRMTNARIDGEKSAVHITFEKITTIVIKREDRSEFYNVVWLRLHNNLKGPISFYSYDESVSPTGKKGIHYGIEKTSSGKSLNEADKEIPNGFPPYDIANYTRLESGKSYLFGIPQFHLIEDTRIAIQIFYPWQVGRESPSDQTVNFVYFYEVTIEDK